ncbi:MAG: leucyl/phenylalanyl-tRNA--protein transferase [Pseudomonadota bacterium]
MSLYWLGTQGGTDFPPAHTALNDPNGLLAAGGDLSEERLLAAYQKGIFPWYSEGQPVLWWSPDPRTVLAPDAFHTSRTLKKVLRRMPWRITFNQCFDDVMIGCAAPRSDQDGTWITDDMRSAYRALHQSGWAHSIEVHLDDALVGGLYGVAIDRMFFGESMFSRVSNASKVAMHYLCLQLAQDCFGLLDCQMHTPHLASLGAENMPRNTFCHLIGRYCRTLKKWRPPQSM